MTILTKLLSVLALTAMVGMSASFASEMKDGMKDSMGKGSMEMEGSAAMSADTMDKEMKPMKMESGQMNGESMGMEMKDDMKMMPKH
ncbi:MAG: hypothetical protein GY696_29055 [Gammaproteobacteria bacterium]|nr:hypothetical protein [Gammaproteobacteria bacterium]